MFFKKEKKETVPADLIELWQAQLFQNMGITAHTDIETVKNCCRKIMLATSRFYANICRYESDMKPIEEELN